MLSPQIQILSKHEFAPLSTETTDENKPIRLSYGLACAWYWTPYGKAFFKEGTTTAGGITRCASTTTRRSAC